MLLDDSGRLSGDSLGESWRGGGGKGAEGGEERMRMSR